MTLHIPTIDPDADVLTAGFAYASAGLYTVPIRSGTKHPGSVLGRGWERQSSREPEMLAAWFAGTDHGIAIHAGRSGLVVLDVDHPEKLPDVLRDAIDQYAPPYQSTRPEVPGKGHYLFATPPGRVFGNGVGKLGGAWGEIRGLNGVIVVAPSIHPDGGRYRWRRAGPIPVLPDTIAELLTDATQGEDAATDAEVLAFLDTHTGNARPELLDAWLTTFQTKVAEGESRHQRMVSVAAGAFSEARAGYFPARDAMEKLEAAFLDAVTHDPLPGSQQGNARGPGMAKSEWLGISAWAVGQAAAADLDQVRGRVKEKMPDGNDLSWIPDKPPPGVDPATGEILDPDAFGDSPTITGPAAGNRERLRTTPAMFFDKHEGLLALELAKTVLAMGPIATDHGQTLYRYGDGVWRDDGDRVTRGRVAELLQNRYRMAHASTAADMLRNREPAFNDYDWDTRYLNLPNGLLDWRTGQLHPHDPAIASIVRIPVEWDPNATCPEIEKWIGEVFPADAREFVEEVIGYCLLFDNPLHKAILLFGRGRNGKGTFLRLLKSFIGGANVSAVTPQSLDDNRFRAAELHGKLANLVGDVDPRIFKVTETFKQITGGDMVTAERKYGQPFRFYCRALLIAAFNALPRSSDTSEGFFSRWIVVPFTGYFPPGVADPGREDKLHNPAELRGLLVLAVRGLQRIMGRRRFEIPASVEEETKTFRRVADPVRAFLEEYIATLVTHWVPRTEVYTKYHDWAITNGYGTMSAAGFYERMEACGHDIPDYLITASKRQGTRGYLIVSRDDVRRAAGAEGAASPTPARVRVEKDAAPAPSAPADPICRCGWGLDSAGCHCRETTP